MNWVEWDTFVSQLPALTRDYLSDLKSRINSKRLDVSYEIKGIIPELYLKSGDLELLIVNKEMEKVITVKKVNSRIPKEILSFLISSRYSWDLDVMLYLEKYGVGYIPCKDKTEVQLKDILANSLLKSGDLSYVEALQELAARAPNKTAFLKQISSYHLGEGIQKCSILNLWFFNRDLLSSIYSASQGNHDAILLCRYTPKEIVRAKFLRSAGVYYDIDQLFVNMDNFSQLNGKRIPSTTQEIYIPFWKFEAEYSRADCGHYEEHTRVLAGRCQKCYQSISKTGQILNNYSTKAPKYLGYQNGNKQMGKYEGKNILYYGAEIELENGREVEAVKILAGLGEFVICKEDGSIPHGFEIVTAPATYDIHRKKAETLFTIITQQTKLQATKACGLHFHVSKNALTILQIGKMLEFMYNPPNREFIVSIAGRQANYYASMDCKKSITEMAPDKFIKDNQERREAINLANTDTIEFRIFASTTEYAVFMYRLDFVKALIDFTKPCAVNVKNLAELKEKDIFIRFVKENNKEYPFLTSFLKLKREVPEGRIVNPINKEGNK